MRKSFKIILALWSIAMVAWIIVMVANIRTLGWEIIGPRDIWPMALATGVMIICVVTERKNKPKAGEDAEPAGSETNDGEDTNAGTSETNDGDAETETTGEADVAVEPGSVENESE